MPEEKKVEKKAAAPEPAQSSGSSDSNLFGMLCYFISFWVPLFVLFTDKKNDKFVAFHAYHPGEFSDKSFLELVLDDKHASAR